MRKLLSALLLLAVLAACSAPPPSAPELQELLRLINEKRASGLDCGGEWQASTQLLISHPFLNHAAQLHAEDMDAAKEVSHDTPVGAVHFSPGTTFSQRIQSTGYSATYLGENVAGGAPLTTPQDVLDAWIASPPHCKGMMASKYTEAGLGRSGVYWALDLGGP